MTKDLNGETLGAWIIHHGRKLQADQAGAAEFPSIDGAAKSGLLLAGMAASDETSLSAAEVEAVAKAAKLNPKTELKFHLEQLRSRQVIDISSSGDVQVLGVSSRKVLQETAALFGQHGPTGEERAVIDVAEQTSGIPQLRSAETKRISDEFKLSSPAATDLLSRMEGMGLVDFEVSGSDRILFNGNLFRRGNIQKTQTVLNSLSAADRQRAGDFSAKLESAGCIDRAAARKELGDTLFEKLLAAGFYDVNTVSNDSGEHVFVTAPGAFHKFVDPMVDDAFDSAKALVAALTYGISKSASSRGRITMPAALLNRLVAGNEIGPATAIGQDYRVLELRRVIKLRPAGRGMYFMRLLKKDVGQIAQQVLLHGGASDQVVALPSASMTAYKGPEESRERLRKQQRPESKKLTSDILQALREEGGSKW
ncbi:MULTISPECIES: hypothetical protein [Ramlibacter]|uniref:Uncharacterized protein n=1 Tax=Ramlibacter pinisoli TaxID=2682844 RepID=A0A6N8IT48_9BURK|nr:MULTISPECIES: hypothetical protein [Ramlibacter]MBA2965043.1 hypothetical protein [Ramlibacter sp. CGMCC 1.13660]MVQ30008.1 hypothetical protein [Ramlibacter pinisoli]